MKDDGNSTEALGRAESLALMRSVPIGRIVFTEQALPAIRPVGFRLDGETVVIHTGLGSSLSRAVRDSVVAFQADAFESGTGHGWSVTVLGEARSWRDGIRIGCHQVSGQRIGP
ncbi:pyridoxamine 5'-phosphate oxidase family protein [Spirillospora sp. NPDC047279]|uniref:pyridoxamine 5'-phosphate oxidase family protein n=1 Tax=Spirillospora sp. NPDC047279 TaxID=3155478 RepID=UPI0033C57F50